MDGSSALFAGQPGVVVSDYVCDQVNVGQFSTKSRPLQQPKMGHFTMKNVPAPLDGYLPLMITTTMMPSMACVNASVRSSVYEILGLIRGRKGFRFRMEF